MSTTIDSLSIQIEASSSKAAEKINQLTSALSNLKSNTKLTTVTNNLGKLNTALQTLGTSSSGMQGIKELGAALNGIQTLGKPTNLTSTLNQLKKIPEITNSLDPLTLERFSSAMNRLHTAIKPLAADMAKIGATFSKLPINIRGATSAMKRMSAGSLSLSAHHGKLFISLKETHVKLLALIAASRRLFDYMGDWVATASSYEENLNLFSVSMGRYAEEAQAYAETIEDLMGIDSSQWMRNQGTFMAIAKGFGLLEEQAYHMSRGLTELAYDLSSFFNIALDSAGDGALDKVKSAIAGELEPLRRLGFALDQATLQQVAFNHGVRESFATMTQAEKAILRYTAMVEQAQHMGAVGDLSRTIDTFSNQMRILKQRFVQLGRAAGQAIIPALQAILPWIQAAIVLFTKAAQAVAAFFGYSLTKIDYSSPMEDLSQSAGDATSSLGGAKDAAEELKDAVMGIDELNIIRPDKDSGGGGGGGAGGGNSDWANDWQIESLWDKSMLEQINSQVDQIVEKLEKALKPLKEILELVWEFRELILAGLALAAIVKLWKKVKGIWAAFLSLGIVDDFLTYFRVLRLEGNTFAQSLTGSLDEVRKGFTNMQKVAITAIAALIEFAVVKKVFRDLVKGTKNLGAGIAELAIVITAASAAMYVALGGIGLLIAGMVALTAAALGYNEASREMIDNMVDSLVFDDLGSSLDVLSTRLELVSEQYTVQYDTICQMSEALTENREKIEALELTLSTFTASLGSNGTITREEVQKLKDAFAELYAAIKENMENSANIILTSLAGALSRAVPEVKGHIEELIGEYQRFVRETQGRAGEIEIEANRIYDSLVGMVPDSAEYQQAMTSLGELYKELGALEGGMSDAEWQWGQMTNAFDVSNVDWSSVEDAKGKIEEIGTAGSEVLTALATSRDAALKAVDESIAYAAEYKPEDLQMLYDVRAALEADYAAQEATIKGELESIFTDISNALAMEAANVAENALTEFENLGGFEQFWQGSAENFAAQSVESFNETIFTPLSESLATAAKETGLSAEAIGLNTVEGLVNGVQSSPMARDLPNLMGTLGLDTLLGYTAGIEENLGEVESTATDLANTAIDTTRFALASHSPSEVFKSIGHDTVDGYRIGLEEAWPAVTAFLMTAFSQLGTLASNSLTEGLGGENGALAAIGTTVGTAFGQSFSKAVQSPITSTISQVAGDVASKWQSMCDGLVTKVQTAVSKINAALASIERNILVTVTVQMKRSGGIVKPGSVPLNAEIMAKGGIIHAAAAGGRFDQGQLFIAREAGPELVANIGRGRTGVMNNDQIVESVSNGVYRAVVDALATQSGDSGGDIVLVLGDQEVYRSAMRGAKASGYSLSSNPTFA